jgi:hypothetical protein
MRLLLILTSVPGWYTLRKGALIASDVADAKLEVPVIRPDYRHHFPEQDFGPVSLVVAVSSRTPMSHFPYSA